MGKLYRIVHLQYDADARAHLLRQQYPIGQCPRCGKAGRLWIYWWEMTNGLALKNERPKPYCGISCYRAAEEEATGGQA